MSRSHKECEGCMMLKTCNMEPKYKTVECPCVSCLVKGICLICCEPYDGYVKLYYLPDLRNKLKLSPITIIPTNEISHE